MNKLKHFLYFLPAATTTILSACAILPDSPETVNANGHDIIIGSPEWQAWVEATMKPTAEIGLGPEIGSEQWCQFMDQRLYPPASGLKPCDSDWNAKVTETLKNQTP